jgi:hypothetical protein
VSLWQNGRACGWSWRVSPAVVVAAEVFVFVFGSGSVLFVVVADVVLKLSEVDVEWLGSASS